MTGSCREFRVPVSPSFATHALPNGLASHQLDALGFIYPRDVALLAHVTAAGKTAVAMAVIAYAFDEEGAARALWVTEAHLIRQTIEQAERFLPWARVSKWPGRESDDVRVISVETLTRQAGEVTAWGAKVVIHDEATSMKGQGVEPQAVSRVMGVARRRVALTATPLELDAVETYRILSVLGADLPPEDVFEAFVEWEPLPFGEQRPGVALPPFVGAVRDVFGKYVQHRTAEQVGLVLPELEVETIWVQLTQPQQRALERAGRERNPVVAASKRDRACQHAFGRSAKAEGALAWLRSHPDVAKAIVFAEDRAHLTIVEGLLADAGIRFVRIDGPRTPRQRAKAMTAFRDDPKVRVLTGTRALERGLDGLQHCSVLLSLGATFNPAREAQRIGRIRRPGSAHRSVLHVTFSAYPERAKLETLKRRSEEAARLLHNLNNVLLTDAFDELLATRPGAHMTNPPDLMPPFSRTEFRFLEHVFYDLDWDTQEIHDAAAHVRGSTRVMPAGACGGLGLPRGSTFAQGADSVLHYQRLHWPEHFSR